ncbi:MAG: GAF domain-containing protein [Chloroflexi bacterium]|nr:GAF domain-containing protein [Chloroflexota bacterium]
MDTIHLLLLEDKVDDTALIQLELEQTGLNFEYIHVKTESDYLKCLSPEIDLILADYNLPRFTALQALDHLQQTGLDIPFIIVSGMINEEFAVECMKRGAADYLLKDRLARLGTAVQQALQQKELRERTRALEASEREQREFALALNDSIRALTSTLDLDKVMHGILDNAVRVVPHDLATILLAEGDTLHFRYWRSNVESIRPKLAKYEFSLKLPVLQERMRAGTVRNIPDVKAEPEWPPIPDLDWVQSCLSVPVKTHNSIIGFLSLYKDVPNAFSETHGKWLQTFASEAAIAIENARLYAKTREDAARLDMLNRATSLLFTTFTAKDLKTVGQEIVQAVVNEFDFVDCGVVVLDGVTGEIIRLARTGSYEVRPALPLEITGPGLVPEAIRTGLTIYARDVTTDARYLPTSQRTRSELAIPLLSGERVVGALDFQSPYLDAFNERDQTLLEALAMRVATVIENMQLYEHVRYSVDELEDRVENRTQALALEKERVEAILDATSDAILLVRDDIIEQVNPAFVEMYGYSEEQMVGQSLKHDYSVGMTELWVSLRNLLQSEKIPVRRDVVTTRSDGIVLNVEVTAALVSPNDEDLIVVNIRDISARKEAEDGLRTALAREQELRELKSRFIAIVSHEFRNPLSMIQLSASTLQSYYERLNENERDHHFENIDTQVQHMNTLLEDVLVLESEEARRGNLQRVPTNLVSLCWEVISGFQSVNSQNRQIVYHYPESGLENILLDPKLIRQLITNLVSNAVKYSTGSVYVTLLLSGHTVDLSVKDDGIGIPEEDQQQLFQPFHRARNTGGVPGTGLGLLVAKNAVELHDGTIHLQSKVGVGTTVTATFPILKEEQLNGQV